MAPTPPVTSPARPVPWAASALVAALLAAAWVVHPAAALAAAGLLGALVTAILLLRGAVRERGLAVVALLLTLALGRAAWEHWRIATDWPGVREALVNDASDRLGGDLDAAFDELERLGAAAAATAPLSRSAAFDRLAGLLPDDGPEVSLTLLDRAGVPIAWAGVHHRIPEPRGPAFGSRSDGLYLLLDSRHPAADGTTAVATILLWANPMAPRAEGSVVEAFRERTGVGLRVFGPGASPTGPDVFDYAYPDSTAPGGRRVLFSVVPEAPEPAEAATSVTQTARPWVLGLAALLLLAVLGRGRGWERRVALPVLAVVALAAVGGARLNATSMVLIGASAVLALVPAALAPDRRRRLPGVLLLLVSPLAFVVLAPALPLPHPDAAWWHWVGWQVALFLAAAVPAALGSALMPEPSSRHRGALVASIGTSLLLLAVGAWRWAPTGMPAWVPAAWALALLPLSWAAGHRARLLGVAVALGGAAGLVTWSGHQERRLALATADLGSLGTDAPTLASMDLGDAVRRLARTPVPGTPTELFLRWRRDPLAAGTRPAVVAVWDTLGAPIAMLALDSLDLDATVLAGFARSLAEGDPPALTQLVRTPGLHQVALQRQGDRVVGLVLGPPSALVPRTRLGRLLLPAERTRAQYAMALGPPAPAMDSAAGDVGIVRDRWTLRAERQVRLPEGTRLAVAAIDLRGPGPLALRALLLLALNAGLLLLLSAVQRLGAARPADEPRGPRPRSFRVRLGVALAMFFLAPAVVFTVWGLARLAEETAQQRDAGIERVLLEAGPPSGRLLRGPDIEVAEGLADLGAALDGELALYSGGVLLASSAPILRDLGVVAPLLDPEAYRALTAGTQVTLVRAGDASHGATRLGYRVVQAGAPANLGVVATPRAGDEGRLRQEQLDLALALVAAALLGALAAVGGAGAVSRALARPVGELRDAALAIGAGHDPPASRLPPPVEFAPVFAAMQAMSRDIRSSRAALEAARARTAAVLRSVATGVVAVDGSGRILLANPRAEELVGRPLPEGALLDDLLPSAWMQLAVAVGAAEPAAVPIELTRDGRQIGAELARLPGPAGGVVIALNDLTEAGRAARVLAWGEMARQVAHEIKNPLTPLRLGIQHLRRAWVRDPSGFGDVLEETGHRVLAEIDRLDTIARIFSRFGAPGDVVGPLEPVDLEDAVREVAALYRLTEDGARVDVTGGAAGPVAARRDEVKEVLVNLLENARNAGAGVVVIEVAPERLRVRDDGRGIAPADLPRVFEPRFSTTTSGSGLGLAIVRRLVEGWGATIRLDSAPGRGTTVVVEFPRPGSSPTEME